MRCDEAIVIEGAEGGPRAGVLEGAHLQKLADDAATGEVEVGVHQLAGEGDLLREEPGEGLGQESRVGDPEAGAARGPGHLVIDGEDVGQVEGGVVVHPPAPPDGIWPAGPGTLAGRTWPQAAPDAIPPTETSGVAADGLERHGEVERSGSGDGVAASRATMRRTRGSAVTSWATALRSASRADRGRLVGQGAEPEEAEARVAGVVPRSEVRPTARSWVRASSPSTTSRSTPAAYGGGRRRGRVGASTRSARNRRRAAGGDARGVTRGSTVRREGRDGGHRVLTRW